MYSAYAMNDNATGAMMAPDIFPARHLESSVLHDVVKLDPSPGAKLLPLSNDRAKNMTSTEIFIHCKNVLSLAKKVLGSTRVRTREELLFTGVFGSGCVLLDMLYCIAPYDPFMPYAIGVTIEFPFSILSKSLYGNTEVLSEVNPWLPV